MELSYDVVFCLLVILGYTFFGLPGTGVALSVANALDLLALWTFYHHRYKYSLERATLLRAAFQAVLLAATLALCLSAPSLVMRCTVGGGLFALSLAYSVYSYKDEILHTCSRLQRPEVSSTLPRLALPADRAEPAGYSD